ncbi:MAG: hypothetical protein GXP48_00075, partial [Acidobacteria bacterium]|nr:hypothetical protein [Acidobacteriota bacterium]
MLNNMHDTTLIENQQQGRYPGLRVRRDGDVVVVHIPACFRRRNGRCMILTDGEPVAVSSTQRDTDANGGNRTLIEAIAKAHRWQQQLESGEYTSLEDLAQAVGVDRTYVGRMLRLTSLVPDIIEAILRGDEPDGLSLRKLQKGLPVRWDEQR